MGNLVVILGRNLQVIDDGGLTMVRPEGRRRKRGSMGPEGREVLRIERHGMADHQMSKLIFKPGHRDLESGLRAGSEIIGTVLIVDERDEIIHSGEVFGGIIKRRTNIEE